MLQKTLSILKPDAVRNKLVGNIINYIYNANLSIVAIQSIHLTKAQAESFYAVHKDRPFFNSLVDFMISGKVIVQVLSGNDAVKVYREVMGDTDPKKAKKGTIRADFAESIEANCVHGSDSEENAKEEIRFFFPLHSIISE